MMDIWVLASKTIPVYKYGESLLGNRHGNVKRLLFVCRGESCSQPCSKVPSDSRLSNAQDVTVRGVVNVIHHSKSKSGGGADVVIWLKSTHTKETVSLDLRFGCSKKTHNLRHTCWR
jgi:hypothetical protein